jgi:cell division protein FtsI/penicillin-binding protein 2
MCFFAISIIYRICIIQFVEGNYWLEKAKAYTTKIEDMEAVRGNIFDANG